MTLTITGLGPGQIDDLSRRAWQSLENASTVYLLTAQLPCVPNLPQSANYHDFDHLSGDFESITAAIVDAAKSGDVVYAVPGDPLVGQSTVTPLLAAARQEHIEVEIINGISFVEPVLKLVEHKTSDGLQLQNAAAIANMHHPPLNPDTPALLLGVYSREIAAGIKQVLMNQYPADFSVKLIHSAGDSSALVETLPLSEITAGKRFSHQTALYIPALGDLASFESFQEVVAHLRSPDGCPWDRKQTHKSLRPFLLEEAYEVLETIDSENAAELCAELGDLMLQIVLHVQVAVDEGEFYMGDVIRHINHKMIRRHPHVWGDVDVQGDPQQVLSNWEEIKRAENSEQGKVRQSLLDGIPNGLPALLVAHKYQEKVAKVGFDWPDVKGVEDKIREEIEEIHTAASNEERIKEIGDVMFVLVNWLRWLGADDPESVLRETNAKFYRRFRYVENAAAANGKSLTDYTLDEMDVFWEAAKAKGL